MLQNTQKTGKYYYQRNKQKHLKDQPFLSETSSIKLFYISRILRESGMSAADRVLCNVSCAQYLWTWLECNLCLPSYKEDDMQGTQRQMQQSCMPCCKARARSQQSRIIEPSIACFIVRSLSCGSTAGTEELHTWLSRLAGSTFVVLGSRQVAPSLEHWPVSCFDLHANQPFAVPTEGM